MNKKILKAIVSAGLCCCTVLSAAGCKPTDNSNPSGSNLDPETRPLTIASQALDGNFNPFTYTSQADGDIIGLTQIGMFTNDKSGNLVCGQDYATVALNYSTTMYDSRSGGNVTATGSANGRTEYEIVIKNGIKFSDGVSLTIKDVLFNLYVYLDVSYTGSSTIYSTDIQGLKAYREQDPSLIGHDDVDKDSSSDFQAAALERIYNILNWIEDSPSSETVPKDPQIKADLETTYRLFKEEITSDWNSIETTWSSSFSLYNFTEAWQAYLFNENIAWEQTRNNNGNSERVKDDKGHFVTTLEPTVEGANNVTAAVGEIHLQDTIDLIKAAASDDKVAEYARQHDCDAAYAKLQLQKEFCINTVYENYTEKSNIGDVLQYWSTASAVMDEFTAEERTKHYEDLKNKGVKVDNISGITTYNATGAELKSSSKQWKMANETFNDGENYSVLKVVINGIDPKAIFNLAFSVAPMHYYSGTWNGKNYVEDAMNDKSNKEFGVEVGNSKFFTEVISSTDKNGLPVGAGAYKASTRNGGTATARGEFLNSNIVYFERNTNFETVGTGIENAKIKLVRYQVIPDDQVLTNLVAKNIDYGTPNAKVENESEASKTEHLGVVKYQAGGYGYVGINPKFVPELAVRQAIMKAMDTQSITRNYYRGGLAEPIWRPMTKTSWAYPENVKAYPDTAYTTVDSEITELVESAGYKINPSTGKYEKGGKALKLTFTIAGDSSDHPAYSMFVDTADRLNGLGFDISVSTSSTALRDLTRGNLAVWAAAWSSSIDPDPYQIYHKDSKATSVNNWGYKEILNPSNTQYEYERGIIEELSTKIDEGRSYLERRDRTPIYAECLDLIMKLAVELPTYQRCDLCVFNEKVLDRNTMTKDPSAYEGLISEIWKLDYIK